MGFLETLKDEDDAALLNRGLGRIQNSAERMQSLVEDLLLLSKLDSDQAPGLDQQQPVRLGPFIERLCADLEALYPAHRFVLEVDSDLAVPGLERELHSAITNLVTNALRYSPDGGAITICYGAVENSARLSVRDEGLGIAANHLGRLTERFYRVDVGRSREAGGTGLGLAIVKHVLRLHHSELEVSSVLGRGSCFSFALPLTARRGGPEHPNAWAFLQRMLALYLLIPGLGHGAALMLDEALPAHEPTQWLEAQAVTSVGSDTMNNLMSLWTEAFQAYHPGLSAQISGAGSSTAPPALTEGTALFGAMSRRMTSGELQAFEARFGYRPLAFRVAVDALAVFVHKDNPLRAFPKRPGRDLLRSPALRSTAERGTLGRPWP